MPIMIREDFGIVIVDPEVQLARLVAALEALKCDPSAEHCVDVCLASRSTFSALLPAFEDFGFRNKKFLKEFEAILLESESLVRDFSDSNSDPKLQKYADNIGRRGKLLQCLVNGDHEGFRMLLQTEQSLIETSSVA